MFHLYDMINIISLKDVEKMSLFLNCTLHVKYIIERVLYSK